MRLEEEDAVDEDETEVEDVAEKIIRQKKQK